MNISDMSLVEIKNWLMDALSSKPTPKANIATPQKNFCADWIRKQLPGTQLARPAKPVRSAAQRRRDQHRKTLLQWRTRTAFRKQEILYRLQYEFGISLGQAMQFIEGRDYPRPRKLREELMYGKRRLKYSLMIPAASHHL